MLVQPKPGKLARMRWNGQLRTDGVGQAVKSSRKFFCMREKARLSATLVH